MNVILYHGSADARDFLVKQEFYFTDQFVPKADAIKLKKLQVTKFHALITTYEVVLKDIAVLSKLHWKTLIVDEAHRLKNYKARLFMELSTVPRDHCVLLTGTPIANATEELWALLHFANPSIFYDRDEFLERFGEMTDVQQVNDLHALLKPYLLRRVKEDVEKSLPNKEETILEVSLTPIQKTFYKAIYERNTSFLFKGAKASNAPSLMNVMMELRKCCNHPFLIKGAEDRILSEAASKARLQGSSDKETALDQSKLYAEQLVKSSGKMVLMEKLLQKLFDGGHKVLVFSQMVRVLDLLEDLLRIKQYRFERLDGSTSSSSRLHAVERFKKKECNRFVMLLSTRAGGLGLNLTVADIVIIFDSDWNPQNDMQGKVYILAKCKFFVDYQSHLIEFIRLTAMARAHRIGQTRAVKVYRCVHITLVCSCRCRLSYQFLLFFRFLTAKTYEMHMFHSASLKLGLERAVMSQNREQSDEHDDNAKTSKKSNREAQAKEIDQLLKKGAYDVFRDDDDKEAEKFMETDIDQLLEHSSKTVSYDAAATSSLGNGLGSFSKASFVASTDDGARDVDLDDPDFWSKAVGLDTPPDEIPEEIAAMIDDGVKRSRKQVEQYDPYAESSMAEQMKKDQLELERILEEEERDQVQAEKSNKSRKGKDEKRKILRDEVSNQSNSQKVLVNPKNETSQPRLKAVPKLSKEIKPKNGKSRRRARALRRAENEDPIIEQFKQAWEIPQRNRATAAVVRFGFGRFCKLRNESNLPSLPLQDIEIFVRSYCYQLSLQIAVTLLSRLRDGFDPTKVRTLVSDWMGVSCNQEVDWICDSVESVLKYQIDVERYRSYLRIPAILTETTYVEDLRHGAGLRALRRIAVLARLNSIITECVDEMIRFVGPEELEKRGCNIEELGKLDLDQKTRFITTEELMFTVGTKMRKLHLKYPALWWDRSCDVALIVGTFVHGLSNYESLRRDKSLPFGEKISQFCKRDPSSKQATQRFRSTAEATRKVFEDALEAGRIKAELEVQAAVAAAAKAALQREEDAALLRKGGVEAEGAVRNMPETQVDDAFEFDGTDTHFVTLTRMHKNIQEAALSFKSSTIIEGMWKDEDNIEFDDDVESNNGRGQTSRIKRWKCQVSETYTK
jgi:superfamily II DNA or RNA helicase